MRKYLVTLKPAPNDHETGRAQLSATLDSIGVSHSIEEMWYYGRMKAIVTMSVSDAAKVEKHGIAESVCAA
jgi:hypothetical protein